MPNYDFHELHDKEFEVLANRLISKHENIVVDRYKPGRDAGIDGRFYSTADNHAMIIPCDASRFSNTDYSRCKLYVSLRGRFESG